MAAIHPKSPLIPKVMIRINEYYYLKENCPAAAWHCRRCWSSRPGGQITGRHAWSGASGAGARRLHFRGDQSSHFCHGEPFCRGDTGCDPGHVGRGKGSARAVKSLVIKDGHSGAGRRGLGHRPRAAGREAAAHDAQVSHGDAGAPPRPWRANGQAAGDGRRTMMISRHDMESQIQWPPYPGGLPGLQVARIPWTC